MANEGKIGEIKQYRIQQLVNPGILLTVKPADWDTNATKYYTTADCTTHVSAGTVFVASTYYTDILTLHPETDADIVNYVGRIGGVNVSNVKEALDNLAVGTGVNDVQIETTGQSGTSSSSVVSNHIATIPVTTAINLDAEHPEYLLLTSKPSDWDNYDAPNDKWGCQNYYVYSGSNFQHVVGHPNFALDTYYTKIEDSLVTAVAVSNAINSLDVSNITGFGPLKTLKTLQEQNGKISATFQDIQSASTSQKGVVQLETSYTSASTDKAATPKSIKDAYDTLNANKGQIEDEVTLASKVGETITLSNLLVQDTVQNTGIIAKGGTDIVLGTAAVKNYANSIPNATSYVVANPQPTSDSFETNRYYTRSGTSPNYVYKLVDTYSTGTTYYELSNGNLTTVAAVKSYVDNKITQGVEYLGVVNSINELNALDSSAGEGDWVRVGTQFTYNSETCHVGDILVCLAEKGSSTHATWDVIHTEVDTDTNQKIKAGSVTFGVNDVIDIVGTGATTVTGLASGTGAPKITISSANTATAADNILHGTNSGTQITYAPYTSKGAGHLYTVVTTPGSTNYPTTDDNPLGYDGKFYARRLYEGPNAYEVLNDHSFRVNGVGISATPLDSGGMPVVDFSSTKTVATTDYADIAFSSYGGTGLGGVHIYGSLNSSIKNNLAQNILTTRGDLLTVNENDGLDRLGMSTGSALGKSVLSTSDIPEWVVGNWTYSGKNFSGADIVYRDTTISSLEDSGALDPGYIGGTNVTTSEPSNWLSSWQDYYTYDSTTQKYIPVRDQTAPTWESNKYYSAPLVKDFTAVRVNRKGIVVAGGNSVEVGTTINGTPSNQLVYGGIYYQLIAD